MKENNERPQGCTCNIGTADNPIIGGYARCPIHDPNYNSGENDEILSQAFNTPPIAIGSQTGGEEYRSLKDITIDEIAGVLYKNISDGGDDGAWIDSTDFYKIADLIYKRFPALHPASPSAVEQQGEEKDGDKLAEMAELIDESIHYGRSGFEIAEILLHKYKL